MRVAAALMVVLSMIAAAPAGAEVAAPCASQGEPWIRIKAALADPRERELVIVQLRAAMKERKIALCTDGDLPAADPIATMEIGLAGAESVAIAITVRDAVTDKRLARNVDLSSMPADSRPLTLALAAEELLRASWAELVMLDPRPPPRPVPPEVIAAVERPPLLPPPAPPGPPRFEIGAAATAEHFGGGFDALGGDVVAKLWPWARAGVRARLGFRSGASASVPDGDVRSTGVVFASGPTVALFPRTLRAGIDAFAEGVVTHLTVIGEPRKNARASDEGATAFYLTAGAAGWYALLPALHVFVEGAVGAPVHTVRVAQGSSSVTALSGAYLAASAGIAGAL